MRQRVPLQDIVFDAVDGEAFTDAQGHHYALLVASCYDTGWKQSWNSLSAGKKQLPTWACLRALTELGRSSSRIHVAFYMNYDVTKWVEDLTKTQKKQLWHTGRVEYITPYGVWYELSYLPRKLFGLTTRDKDGKKFRMVIYDVFGFFQKKFSDALRDWGLTEEIEFIERMKGNRKKFQASEIAEIERYSLMECDLLCQLMNKVRDALISEDIPLTKWMGSGSIAEAILHKYNMAQHIRIPVMENNDEFMDAVLRSYFGGRFELFKQGTFKESHNYDINSAYPSSLAELPSFANCTIRAVERYNSEAPYSLWYVQYDVGTEFPIGPLPYRTKTGSIVFPFKNEYGVWIHQVELRNALKLYGSRHFKILFGYIITPKSQTQVYTFIPTLAERRLALKRRKDQRNIVLKLGLNALYGKTAQAISSANVIPPFQNFYIAGYITAATRAKLLRFAFGCGYRGVNVISFATDGIFSTKAHNLYGAVSSEKLGEWEYKKIDRLTLYLKPGILFSKKTGEESETQTNRKTRGFKAASITAREVFRAWYRDGPYAILSIPDQRFIGIGTCLVTDNWKLYGRFNDASIDLRFGPGPTKWYKFGGQNPTGLGEHGVSERGPDYYILVPFQDKVDDISRPYKIHYRDRTAHLDEFEPEIQNLMREEISLDEQRDYEQYAGISETGSED